MLGVCSECIVLGNDSVKMQFGCRVSYAKKNKTPKVLRNASVKMQFECRVYYAKI